MMLIGFGRAAAAAAAATVAETAWDTGDWLNLQSNGVSVSAPGWTVAIAARANDDVNQEWFVADASSGYIRRQGSAGTFRVRWRDTANAIVSDQTGGSVAKGTPFSLLASIGTGSATSRVWLNGAPMTSGGVGGVGNAIRGPNYVNAVHSTGINAANLRYRALWIGPGYLDPATHYPAFFGGDGIPSAAMLGGAAIGGLSPQFARGGNAASWKALAGLSGGFDLQDV